MQRKDADLYNCGKMVKEKLEENGTWQKNHVQRLKYFRI